MMGRQRRLRHQGFYSIRLHLIASLLLPVALLLLLAWAFASSLISNQSDRVFDRLLLGMAKSIEQRLTVRDGELSLNMPYFSLDVIESASAEKMFYRVEKENGELLAGFKGLPFPHGAEAPDPQQPVMFYNTVFAGNPLRAVFLYIPGDTEHSSALITVAESLNSRETFTEDLLQVLALIVGVACVLLLLATVFAIQRGLKPLNRLAEQIQQRPEHDLSPLQIQMPVPKEVRPLLESLHTLIGRTKDNIEHIQHFNADVSHQLRTPLAEIKTLSQLGQRADTVSPAERERLAQIEAITDFLTHTTEQLLAYAKSQQSLLEQQKLQPLDLTALLQEQARQQAPRIYRAGAELEFSAPKTPVWIQGDPMMLAGVLNNLLDNALLYGHNAEEQAQICLSLQPERSDPAGAPDQVVVTVADRGPGIPESELEAVTDRFVRLDQQTSGSGLGLAIVRQLCVYHDARLQLKNRSGGGLEAQIRFPLLNPEAVSAAYSHHH